MKKITILFSLTFSLVLSLFLTQKSFAESLHPDTYVNSIGATLTDIHMDKNLEKLFPPTIDSGSIVNVDFATVEINFKKKNIALKLYSTDRCPPNRVCTQEIKVPKETLIQLPLVQVSKGSCGATVYTAKVDYRPVDGLLHEIIVVDYSTILCEIVLQYPTHVQYKIAGYNGLNKPVGSFEYISLLKGNKLSVIPQNFKRESLNFTKENKLIQKAN